MGIEIKLQGWKAWVVGVPLVLLLFIGSRVWLTVGVTAKAREPLRQEIASQYMGSLVSTIQAAGQGQVPAQTLLDQVAAAGSVEIKAASGRKTAKGIIVRVEYTLAGKPPPDGRSPRYYVMEERLLGDWRVKWESSALTYYLALW